MSTENVNLEEMVEKTLESNGVLPKIRVSQINSKLTKSRQNIDLGQNPPGL